MKAMVYREYGPPENLEYLDLPKPNPGDGEVLVEVQAASVNWIDWHFLTGTPFMVRLMAGLTKPKNNILGIDLAGTVEEVGKNISDFSPGDEVFGTTSHGCFSEFVSIPEDGLVLKPANLSFEEAAAVPAAASVALQGLRDAGIVRSGQKVLINGASGGVGTFAVQLAKHFQAEVTGVCSTGNLELVRSLGADQVIDYTQEDFTNSSAMYNLIFDKEAVTFLEKLPKLNRERIFSKLLLSKENPFRYFIRLQGRPEFKLRLGKYRVIADIEVNTRKVLIRLIGHRKSIYQKI